MALPSCQLCGETDPQHMVGLMTLWFGPFIDLEPGHGYFHLCPACYEDRVAPDLDEIQANLARLNPAAAAYLERERAMADAEKEEEAAGAAGDAGTVGDAGDAGDAGDVGDVGDVGERGAG